MVARLIKKVGIYFCLTPTAIFSLIGDNFMNLRFVRICFAVIDVIAIALETKKLKMNSASVINIYICIDQNSQELLNSICLHDCHVSCNMSLFIVMKVRLLNI